jgi:thiamine kinase
MNNALTPSVQARLQQALAQWRHWRTERPLREAPRVLHPLEGGLSNHSFLLQGEGRYVLRLDRLNPAAMGVNRQAEWHTLQLAADAGLAPTPRYFNPELGCLVRDFLEEDDTLKDETAATAQLLRHIHALPPVHHRLDLRERISHYENQLQRRGQALSPEALELRQAAQQCLQLEQASAPPRALCHNDLLRANRLRRDGRLWAIDWEYCAMGNPWWDLAVTCRGDLLPAAEQARLLTLYLGRAPAAPEWRELDRQTVLFRYIERLWHEAGGTAPAEAAEPSGLSAGLAQARAAAAELGLHSVHG